jgi:hypothetical protein
MTRTTVKLIHEGRYAAQVPVELIEDETGRVFELKPITP